MALSTGLVELYNRLPRKFEFMCGLVTYVIEPHDTLVVTHDVALMGVKAGMTSLDSDNEDTYTIVPHTRKDLWKPIKKEPPRDPIKSHPVKLDSKKKDSFGRKGKYVVISVKPDPDYVPYRRGRIDRDVITEVGER